MSLSQPAARPQGAEGGKERRRRRRWQQKLLREAQRPLSGWQRLHVLSDLVDESRRMVEVADHKARFALVIIGAVNAALLLLATRTHLAAIPPGLASVLVILLLPYGLFTLHFLAHAIEVLRPHPDEVARDRSAIVHAGPATEENADQPLGLFYWSDILRNDLEAYDKLWREARVGQVNAELALIAHALARVTQHQYEALGKLFSDLKLVLALAALLLVALAAFSFR